MLPAGTLELLSLLITAASGMWFLVRARQGIPSHELELEIALFRRRSIGASLISGTVVLFGLWWLVRELQVDIEQGHFSILGTIFVVPLNYAAGLGIAAAGEQALRRQAKKRPL